MAARKRLHVYRSWVLSGAHVEGMEVEIGPAWLNVDDADGAEVNRRLVENGLAVDWSRYSGGKYLDA